MNNRLRVAWFSSLSGGSVSNFVTRLLLEPLSKEIDLTIFHNGERGAFQTSSGEIPIFHYLKAVERDERQPFDLFFYHLEDRKECDFMRIHLALKPGVVWFHDLFLSNHGPEPILNSSWSEIVERFSDLKRAWPKHDREYTSAGVLAEREAGMSFLPLFSNPRDHSEYNRLIKRRLCGDDAKSLLLRHPVPQALFERKNGRRAGDALNIALSALPRVESQVHHFFEALTQSTFSGTVHWPVPAVEISRAEELVSEFELRERCQIIAGEGPQAWENVLANVDVGVHLRFSAFGQPSPYLPMTLAAGLPALVTDFAAGAAYPANAVFKISPGQAQVAEIALVLQQIQALSAEVFRENSRSYAREFSTSEVVSRQLLDIFAAELPRLSLFSKRWRAVEHSARQELIRESKTLGVQDAKFMSENYRTLVDPIFTELGWSAGESQ